MPYYPIDTTIAYADKKKPKYASGSFGDKHGNAEK